MVAPLVLIGGGMVAGAMALWAAIRQALDLSKPIKTRKGNGVRILTSQRISSDGCPIVAAVNCGGDIGEVISTYTKSGVFGGTLWTMDEHCVGSLSEPGERDFTGLINASEPGPAPLSPEPVGVVYSIPRPPLDFSRTMRTQLGNRVQILAMDRIDPTDNRIMALVHLQWLDNDPGVPRRYQRTDKDLPRRAGQARISSSLKRAPAIFSTRVGMECWDGTGQCGRLEERGKLGGHLFDFARKINIGHLPGRGRRLWGIKLRGLELRGRLWRRWQCRSRC